MDRQESVDNIDRIRSESIELGESKWDIIWLFFALLFFFGGTVLGLTVIRNPDEIFLAVGILGVMCFGTRDINKSVNPIYFLISFVMCVSCTIMIGTWIIFSLFLVSFVLGLFAYIICFLKLKKRAKKYGVELSMIEVWNGRTIPNTLPKEIYDSLEKTKLQNSNRLRHAAKYEELSTEDLVRLTQILDVAENLDPYGDSYEEYMSELSKELYDMGTKLEDERSKRGKEKKYVANSMNEELMSTIKK